MDFYDVNREFHSIDTDSINDPYDKEDEGMVEATLDVWGVAPKSLLDGVWEAWSELVHYGITGAGEHVYEYSVFLGITLV